MWHDPLKVHLPLISMENFQDVFISYGRPDSKEFVVRLSQRLAEEGLQVWVDLHNIPLGVDYQQQIDRDLERAHNFLFVISPHSVHSQYCAIELNHALRCHKRIIPLLHVEAIAYETWRQRYPQASEDDWQHYQATGKHSSLIHMPAALKKINWVMGREGVDDFDTTVAGLLNLIDRQQNYVQQHTHWLVKALEWQRNQKQSQFLLIGEERQQAEAWLKTRFVDNQPPCTPSDLHGEFITESLKNADNLMTQAFLAYADADKERMEQIQRFLWRRGITLWTNTTSIESGEVFLQSIDRGIEETDTLLFLVSPDSLESPYCQHELTYALSLNKRVIPILVRPCLDHPLTAELKDLQHINLTAVDHQKSGLEESALLKVLQQDAAYYRQHKLLLVKALKWQRQNQNASILLQGYNLRQAEAWLKVAQNRSQSPPTPLQIEFIQASLNRPQEAVLDVFISYSRTDSEFARQLNDALQIQGKTTWFDQESIAAGADFQQEIYRGIASSDNFVFVISPSSVDSPYCADEVNYAAELNKRIVTVLHRSVDAATLPPALQLLQWIDFRRERGDFYIQFSELIRTLDTDRDHVHHHTRWSQRAMAWVEKQRDPDLLLRGSEFAIANSWLQTAQQDQKYPPPTVLQQEFLGTSQAQIEAAERKEKRQKLVLRSLLGLMSAAFLGATGLGLWAFALWRQSEAAQLQAMARTSKALYFADQKPEALVTALQAGQRLSEIPQADRALVLSVLQQAVYGIQELQQLTSHGDQINDIAYSPDGEVFVTVSDDTTVKLWRGDGDLVQILDDHQAPVLGVSFHPNGHMFATASADGTLKLWARDGLLLESLAAHEGPITGLAFNPAVGDRPGAEAIALATAGAEGTLKLWSPTGEPIRTLALGSEGINGIAFSPVKPPDGRISGQSLAVAGEDGIIRLWSLEGDLLQTFEGHQGAVLDVAFSPDGKTLASASRDRTVRVWGLNGQELFALVGHDSEVNQVTFSADGRTIATAGEDSTARLWNLQGEDLQTLSGHLTGVRALAFAPQADMLLTASSDNTVKLWELTGESLQRLRGHSDWVVDVAFSPVCERSGPCRREAFPEENGDILATASGDNTIKLWNRRGEELAILQGHTDWVNGVTFSPDGQTIATVSDDDTARLWTLDGKTLAIFRGHRDDVSSVAFSPDGQTIATTSKDETIKLWNLAGQELKTLIGHRAWVRSVTFSPSGDTLATTCANRSLKLWTRQGDPIASFTGHDDWVREVVFSPDGETIATASADHTAKLWNRDGQVIKTLQGHDYWVLGLAFSPDGQTLATASADNTVKLWSRSGEELQTLYGHKNWVVDVAFSPDGQTLASASGDQTVILWDLADLTLDALMERGCRWLVNYDDQDPNAEMAEVLAQCQR
jgi:WD40 repeat protein